ncbi:MAG: hypothetical protein KDB53_20065, partial [Planctomycetes bacterium]|nr:hypothetical protein [Planctomycetota bacterium]
MIHRNRLLVAATMAACLFVGSQALGQFQSQTLPVGFATTDGSNDTAFPFNTTDDQIWQWHYPASDFLAGSEILITDLSVRAPDGLSAIAAFSVSDLEITLIEASTAVGVHDPVFANNVRRQAVVRRGLFAGTGVPASGRPTADWLSLRLQGRFLYDPSTGNDLIIQVRKCGPTVPFLTNVDGEFGTAVRAGHRTDCNAASL